uniref:Outer membrane efflux protein n=1 Tax=uncultured Acidobacteria bacterium A11 TaxID=1036854 RepID=F8TTK6_9BACT|nr:outer membrane efflux protein [uncultured Acidobacteria bacterium A11]
MRAWERDNSSKQALLSHLTPLIMRPHILLSNSLLIAAVLTTARAADKPTAVSISELVAKTLAANPEIRFYEAEIAAAKAGRATAGRLSNPELKLDLGQKRVRGDDARSEGLAYSVALAQPIEWPGRLGLRKAIANRDIALAELGLERFRAFLASRVKTLGYALAAQQENAAAAAEVADRFTSVREVVVQREPGGIAPVLEARIIEATEVVVQRRAGEAAVEMQKALLEINQLMGRRADTPFEVKRTEFPKPEASTLAALLNTAAEHNYDLRVRRSELEQQGLKVALARNERYPTFTVGPMISQERARDKETTIGLSVSVPLPLWNNGQAAVNTAEARRMQAEASLQSAFREVERKITEAWLILQTQQKRLDGWKADALKIFAEAAQLADRHYRLGAVPLATYIEMQDKYLQATEAINSTRLEALRAALDLEQLIGAPAVKSKN